MREAARKGWEGKLFIACASLHWCIRPIIAASEYELIKIPSWEASEIGCSKLATTN